MKQAQQQQQPAKPKRACYPKERTFRVRLYPIRDPFTGKIEDPAKTIYVRGADCVTVDGVQGICMLNIVDKFGYVVYFAACSDIKEAVAVDFLEEDIGKPSLTKVVPIKAFG